MGNYWLDLDKREAERASVPKPVMGLGKLGLGYQHNTPFNNFYSDKFTTKCKGKEVELETKKTKVRPLTLDQSVLWDSERVNSTDNVDFIMQMPSHSFNVEGMKLISSPNTWIDAPAEFQGLNLRWKVPIRLRYEPKREDTKRLCDWLSGITDGIKELGTLVLYLEKEKQLHEVWTLRDVYPKNISWEPRASAVEFSLGYSDLRQRVVRGGESELLA